MAHQTCKDGVVPKIYLWSQSRKDDNLLQSSLGKVQTNYGRRVGGRGQGCGVQVNKTEEGVKNKLTYVIPSDRYFTAWVERRKMGWKPPHPHFQENLLAQSI